MHKLRLALVFLFLFLFQISVASGQQEPKLRPEKPTSAELFKKIQKLNFLGSALYVAAHPDDENTALISYLANEVQAHTAYLSVTRGDGGQNLIGPEISELLGVIRTQELLAARHIDGGEQRFTRANDFGFSKNPTETLEIWDKQKVLADVVWIIRTLKPDVIVNRFDHRSAGSTHGHHTSSAMLSVEAFDLAKDPKAFPEQLKYTKTWQPRRQFFNTSWWFYGSRENFEKADKGNLVSVDVGTFYPAYGMSNTEIAALSRSQHKSQGFGNTGTRGTQTEYLELINGDYPDNGNLFDGIETSWSRVKGGEAIKAILEEVEKNYNFRNPSASLPGLLKAYPLIQNLEDEHWKSLKSRQLLEIIKGCAGIYVEAVSSQQTAVTNESISIDLEAISRSDFPIRLESIMLLPQQKTILIDQPLNFNEPFRKKLDINTGEVDLTTAYWLRKPPTLGMYTVDDQTLIGKPETPQSFRTVFMLNLNGQILPFVTDQVYKYNDRVEGEIYEPFEIVPPASVSIQEPVIIFAEAEPKTVQVDVTAFTENLKGQVSIKHPKGWKVNPAEQNIQLKQKGESKTLKFTVTPPANSGEGVLEPQITVGGKIHSDKITRINYDHIPLQTLALPSVNKVVRLNIAKEGHYIGYIPGAGDTVPESLKQIGYQVVMLNTEEITPALLEQFDAVVVGIRAYNVVDELKYKQTVLLNYVNKGGTMIVQYNTARGFDFPNLGPYPLRLSSDRVTDENAKVQILDPESPLLNYPNKLTARDFENWVQERGLYFPDDWDAAYKPVISIRDVGETPKAGSILIAEYGQGHYIYTGLSFFRELPAGVPGAYRLFANMLSVGKKEVENENLEIKD